MIDPILERFHRVLIEEIQTQRPEYLTQPFTVAEIYQNLVPYGSHRDRIGVEMNGDYEDALVRLLAGEGEYLILDSEPALRELRRELERASPDTGLYREYAAVDVRLNRDRLDLSELAARVTESEPDEPEPDESQPYAGGALGSPGLRIVPPGMDIFSDGLPEPHVFEGEPDVRAAPVADAASRPPLAPEYVDHAASAGPSPREEVEGDATCRWCAETLPPRGHLKFCPFCGTDVKLVPCASCGEALEPGWSFCIACGAEASA